MSKINYICEMLVTVHFKISCAVIANGLNLNIVACFKCDCRRVLD
jgi:hypothetical protein